MNIYTQTFRFLTGMSMILNSWIVLHGFISEGHQLLVNFPTGNLSQFVS